MPSGAIQRIQWFHGFDHESATKIFQILSAVTELGVRAASIAGPSSPAMSARPSPAMVAMMPSGVSLRTRSGPGCSRGRRGRRPCFAESALRLRLWETHAPQHHLARPQSDSRVHIV